MITKRKISVFWLTVILIMIIFYSMLVLKVNSQPTTQLTKEQQNQLVITLGLNGYKKLLKLGCDKPIAEYLNTGEWSDNWCATHYSHIKIEG